MIWHRCNAAAPAHLLLEDLDSVIAAETAGRGQLNVAYMHYTNEQSAPLSQARCARFLACMCECSPMNARVRGFSQEPRQCSSSRAGLLTRVGLSSNVPCCEVAHLDCRRIQTVEGKRPRRQAVTQRAEQYAHVSRTSACLDSVLQQQG